MAPGDLITGLYGVYRIEARHGEGSFGVTYRARDESSGTVVILKELRIEKLDDWKALELFEREGRTLSSLSHASIPAFHDFFAHGAPTPLPVEAMGTYEGPTKLSLVLVQEFVDGTTLEQRLESGHRLTPDEALAILRTLLGALRYLHHHTPPLVHRDIKPGNVILTSEGRPYLVDFGAIQDRLRSAGSVGSTIVGTLGYMPLEQIRGDARPASDLYALGVTLVVALAGRPLAELSFDDATGKLSIDRVLPPDTPTLLRDVLDGMVAPLLGQRISSAGEALRRLDDGAHAKRELAPPAALVRPQSVAPPATASRSAFPAVAAGVGTLLVAGGALFFLMVSRGHPVETPSASTAKSGPAESAPVASAPQGVDAGTVPLEPPKPANVKLSINQVRPFRAHVFLVSGTDRRDVPSLPITIDLNKSDSWSVGATAKGYEDYTKPLSFDDGRPAQSLMITMKRLTSPEDGSNGCLPKSKVEAIVRQSSSKLAACSKDVSGISIRDVVIDEQGIGALSNETDLTSCSAKAWSSMRFPKAKVPTTFEVSIQSNFGAGFSLAVVY
jgi:Protein kinase domain